MDDDGFVAYVADRLVDLPHVSAVALGGSRAAGTHQPDSDWDFAVYYRGAFSPHPLKEIGWPGEVSAIGGWGGGVFNGGAWLRVDGRRVDLHYRDLDDVEQRVREAQDGVFEIEPLLFHLAGIPTYLVVAELALTRVLRGSLPRPEYPSALRQRAPEVWWSRARQTLDYAHNDAQHGRVAHCAGLLAQAATMTAHAVLATRGEWVTNEKRLLAHAGLAQVDEILAALRPAELTCAVDDVDSLCRGLVGH